MIRKFLIDAEVDEKFLDVIYFRCCACNATFSGDFRNFKRHIAVEHEEIELPSGERVKCDQCDKTYVNKKLLKDHVEIVHLQLKVS